MAITAAMVKELRDLTGAGMMDCKKALVETNNVQSVGYGLDEYCEQARNTIKEKIGRDADVHFLVGGTQTNATFISYVLKGGIGGLMIQESEMNSKLASRNMAQANTVDHPMEIIKYIQ